MRWNTIFGVGVVAIVVAVALISRIGRTDDPKPPRPTVAPENTPVCPWREPDHDLSVLFPKATGYTLESRVLSGLMVEAQKRLGRRLATAENPLRIFRVHAGNQMLGSVIVHRVKGEHGGIEMVTGFNEMRAVQGVLVQSHREPAAVANAITNPAWLAQFRHKTAESEFGVDVAPEAQLSAEAVAEGVRSAAILLELATLPK